VPPLAHDDKQRQLQEELLALGSSVGELLLDSVNLLRQSSLNALERLGDDTRQIHKKRLAIEMGCLSLIATGRPRDERLRRLVAMIEIAAELEHIAEHARRVARVNYLVVNHQLRGAVAGIQRLAEGLLPPLGLALQALVDGNVSMADSSQAEIGDLSAQYEEIHDALLTIMKTKPRIASQALYLSRAAYNLMRAAERVAGVCEWVVFSLTGSMGQAVTVPALDLSEAELGQEEMLTSRRIQR
jgi:phosphate transport system protein